ITKAQRPSRDLYCPRLDEQIVFVACRRLVATSRFGNDHEEAALALHVSVRKATIMAILAAAHLEPHQVVRIIGNAHLIGFGIAHADARLADQIADAVFVLMSSGHSAFTLGGDCSDRAANSQVKRQRRVDLPEAGFYSSYQYDGTRSGIVDRSLRADDGRCLLRQSHPNTSHL